MNKYPREIQDKYSPLEMVNTFQAAKLTGFAVRTLNKMRNTGGGPVFKKIGKRKVVYQVAELQRWIRQRSIGK